MDEATAEETEPMRILEFERDELENDRSVTVIELQDALDVANRQQQNDNGNRPGLRPNRRICRAPERFRNDGDDNEDDDEQQMNIEHLRLKIKEMDEALTGIDEAISAHAERINVITSEMDGRIGPAKTKQEIVEYARVKVKPAFTKYNKLYAPGTILHKSKKAFCANKVFDILFLRTDPSIMMLEHLVDDLKYHRIKLFTEDFLHRMKKEIRTLLKIAKDEQFFDFETDVPESKKYLNRLRTRAQRARQQVAIQEGYDEFLRERARNEDVEWDMMRVNTGGNDNAANLGEDDFRYQHDWKKDPGERSHRLYCWWQKLIKCSRFKKLPCFEEALNLVILKLPSSAPAERVFSQLNYCRSVTGDNALEDVTCVRVKLRCNHDLAEPYRP